MMDNIIMTSFIGYTNYAHRKFPTYFDSPMRFVAINPE